MTRCEGEWKAATSNAIMLWFLKSSNRNLSTMRPITNYHCFLCQGVRVSGELSIDCNLKCNNIIFFEITQPPNYETINHYFLWRLKVWGWAEPELCGRRVRKVSSNLLNCNLICNDVMVFEITQPPNYETNYQLPLLPLSRCEGEWRAVHWLQPQIQ